MGKAPCIARTKGFPISSRTDSHAGRFIHRLLTAVEPAPLARRLAAEFLGTAGLLAVIIGSGIMADALSGGNDGVALIGCTAAIGAGLVVLIWLFAPVSGCHINPAVTLAFLLRREIAPREAALFVLTQAAGGLAGMLAAHAMFDLPLFQMATQVRDGPGQWFSEVVATFGLVLTVLGCVRVRPQAVAPAVGLYIFAACWFTASTSFANPAVTLAPQLHGHLLRDPARGRSRVRGDGDRRRRPRHAVLGVALRRRAGR